MEPTSASQSGLQPNESSPSSTPSILDLSTLEPSRAIEKLLRFYVFGDQDLGEIVLARHRAMEEAACLSVESAENVEEAQYLIQDSARKYGRAKEMLDEVNAGLNKGFIRLRNLETILDLYLKAMVLLDKKIRVFWNSTEPKIMEE